MNFKHATHTTHRVANTHTRSPSHINTHNAASLLPHPSRKMPRQCSAQFTHAVPCAGSDGSCCRCHCCCCCWLQGVLFFLWSRTAVHAPQRTEQCCSWPSLSVFSQICLSAALQSLLQTRITPERCCQILKLWMSQPQFSIVMFFMAFQFKSSGL